MIMKDNKGFSLIELSIVLVIMGIMIAAAASVWVMQKKTANLTNAKELLDAAKENVIAYAMSRGRLPYPDGDDGGDPIDGYEDTGGVDYQCETPSRLCYLPWNTLGTKELDPWIERLRYDVSDLLAGAKQDNICAILYELSLHQTDTGGNTNLPCVTESNDPLPPDGQIGVDPSSGNPLGRSVAAVIISKGEINQETASKPTLDGKNAYTMREYEAASNVPRADYNDLVVEITVNELMTKVCSRDNTVIKIYGVSSGGSFDSIEIPIGSGNCITNLNSTNGYATLKVGQTYKFHQNNNSCTGTSTYTGNFTQAAEVDFAGNKDGKVRGNRTDL